MPTGLNRRRVAIALLTTAALAACSDDTVVTTPNRSLAPSAARFDELPPEDGGMGGIMACKEGGPAGRYYFTVTTSGGGDFYPPEVSVGTPFVDFDGVNPACTQMGGSTNRASWVGKGPAQVTITEVQIPVGQIVDSIVVYSSTTQITEPATPKGQVSKTMTYNYLDRLWFSFYNGTQPASRVPGQIEACQTSGPAGNYTFGVSVKGGGSFSLPNGYLKTVAFNGTTPVCVTMYRQNSTAWAANQAPATVTIVSIPPFGNDPRTYVLTKNGVADAPVYNMSAAPVKMVAYGDDASVKFTATPWNLGNQACSVNYWKNATFASQWTNSGYSKTQLVSSILVVPSSYMKSGKHLGAYTMSEALNFTGGTTVSGRAESLIRSTVAALLNANNPSVKYPSPGSTLTLAANVALATQSTWAMGVLQAATDMMNSASGGCPID